MRRSDFFLAISVVILAAIGFTVLGGIFTMAVKFTSIWWLIGSSVAWAAVILTAGMLIVLSQNPLWQFTVLAVATTATGAYLGPLLAVFPAQYAAIVQQFALNAIYYTAGIALIAGLLGFLWPHSVQNGFWWMMRVTFAFLVASLLAIGGVIALVYSGQLSAARTLIAYLDWTGIALFTVWVFFNMNQAREMPANMSNAIVVAFNVYMDMINIWIRIFARLTEKIGEVAPDVGQAVLDGAVVAGQAAGEVVSSV
jgi:FtsH-binding integral membrane protein